MNKEELASRLSVLFKNKTDKLLEDAMKSEGFYTIDFTKPMYDRIKASCTIEWDNYLNKFDIKRRELHLEGRSPPRNHVRIPETLLLAGERWLDIPDYVAEKFIVLGMP
jgi:hypothetical protein